MSECKHGTPLYGYCSECFGPPPVYSDPSEEITRLRAALADGQDVGFAAGVEAAAKVLRVAVDECCITDDQGRIVDFMYDEFTSKSFASVRVLTPPDATAAAARVLLADEAAMNTLSDHEHRQWAGWFKHQLEQSSPENIERWKRQADMPFTLLSDEEKAADRRFADAALRAIAGDTP